MPNYIGKIEAEWVDPAVELPPDEWHGSIMLHECGDYESLSEGFFARGKMRSLYNTGIVRYTAWLRIGGPVDTVPRAKVQAAVDDIRDFLKIPSNNKIARAQDQGASLALSSVARHTGITPTEQVEDVVPPLS